MILITPLKQFDVIAWILASNFKNSIVSRKFMNKDEFHLIIGHQYLNKFDNMPKKFGIYQWEPASSHLFWKNKFLFKKASFVWDYSKTNIKIFAKEKICAFHFPLISLRLNWNKLSHFVSKNSELNFKCDYTVNSNNILFIGQMNLRRYKIINKFKSLNLPVVWIKNNCWGKDLKKVICQSKIFLNLHLKKENGLELARIIPALSLKAVIISEKSFDYETEKLLSDIVIFTDDFIKKTFDLIYNSEQLNIIKNKINLFDQNFKFKSPKIFI